MTKLKTLRKPAMRHSEPCNKAFQALNDAVTLTDREAACNAGLRASKECEKCQAELRRA